MIAGSTALHSLPLGRLCLSCVGYCACFRASFTASRFFAAAV